MHGLADKGYGAPQLAEIKSMIDAENSDIFDVLGYVAFTQSPKTRQERAEMGKSRIVGEYDDKLRAFLDFVLVQYVRQGVEELEQEKLGALIALKYCSTTEAAARLGGAAAIRDAFIGFQRHLYEI
jgi:type I restriction enzyme, R subunit